MIAMASFRPNTAGHDDIHGLQSQNLWGRFGREKPGRGRPETAQMERRHI
jgi:hypothetical protein